MKYDTALYPSVLADIIAYSDEHFKGARRLNVLQISQYMGKSRAWLYRYYGDTIKGGWTVYQLAQKMAQ